MYKSLKCLAFASLLALSFSQTTYVPDDNFEQALIDLGYDDVLDDYVTTSTIAGIKELRLINKSIGDLTGIEKLTSLVYLEATSNKLSSVNVSKNTLLEILILNDNELTSLDIAQNTQLKELNVDGNKINTLDVSKNTELTSLRIAENQLTELDITNNNKLIGLALYTNQLTKLDLTKNTILNEVGIEGNQIANLDITKNTSLTALRAGGNKLKSLDVSQNLDLVQLVLYENQLTRLDISKNEKLTSLNIAENKSLFCIQVADVQKAKQNVNYSISDWMNYDTFCPVLDGLSRYNNIGFKPIKFTAKLPNHSIIDTNISIVFWKSGAESNECSGCNGRDTVRMRKVIDDKWEAMVGLDTALVAGSIGESMYWYNYVKTVSPKPEHKMNEDGYRFKSSSNPDGLRQLAPGWHKKIPLIKIDTVISWENIPPQRFTWTSTPNDTIQIKIENLSSTYDLTWDESKNVDGDTIVYTVYAKVGNYEMEEILDTTATIYPIPYAEIIEGVFTEQPIDKATVRFTVWASDGTDSVKVEGEDRVLFVDIYEYLSTKEDLTPTEFALHDNYPNPFNPTTQIRFDLPQMTDATVTIYNMMGQKIRTFSMSSLPAGYHTVTWNANNDYGQQVSAGVYLYQLQTKGFVKTKKMVLLK